MSKKFKKKCLGCDDHYINMCVYDYCFSCRKNQKKIFKVKNEKAKKL